MERLTETDETDNAPWRLVPTEEAMSRVTFVAVAEEDVAEARRALAELRAMFANGEMFMAINLEGRAFMGSSAETQEFVASHGGWARPSDAH